MFPLFRTSASHRQIVFQEAYPTKNHKAQKPQPVVVATSNKSVDTEAERRKGTLFEHSAFQVNPALILNKGH